MPTSWDRPPHPFEDARRRKQACGDHPLSMVGDWNVDIGNSDKNPNDWKFLCLDEAQARLQTGWAQTKSGDSIHDLEEWTRRWRPPHSAEFRHRIIDWPLGRAMTPQDHARGGQVGPQGDRAGAAGETPQAGPTAADKRCWLAKQRGCRPASRREREAIAMRPTVGMQNCTNAADIQGALQRVAHGVGPPQHENADEDDELATRLRECEERREAWRRRAAEATDEAGRIRCGRAAWPWRLRAKTARALAHAAGGGGGVAEGGEVGGSCRS